MSRTIQPRTLSSAAALLLALCQQAQAQQASAHVDVVTADGSAPATTISQQSAANQQVFNIQLTGRGNAHLKWVNVTLTPGAAIPEGTTYAIGADEMLRREGNVVITQTGKPIRNKDNNTYLMFRNAGGDYTLVGVLSWRTFLCQLYVEDGLVHLHGDGDNRLLKAGAQLPFEKVVYLRDRNWQALLDRYADLIVKENKVPPPPKVTWKGWATWDFYVQHFEPEDVTRNTKLVTDLKAGTNIIQIDGGWWKQRGDYFDVRENIPGGIKAMVARIHAAGYKAGLHFDGFRVSKGANIVKEHPEWFVRTDSGALLEQGKDPVTKDPLVYFDFSHPGAQHYITGVMKNARENWKVDYFKIDFMRNGLNAKGKSYLPVTNVERYRMGIVAMRKGIGNAYFLACSPNFGVNIGLIEASRTGPDIDPSYDAVKIRAQHNSGSYYFHRKIYNCDPDYLVLRSKAESNEHDGKKPSLTTEQGAMWANFVSIFGNVRLESDELSLLPEEKTALIRKAFAMPFFAKAVPMDFWEHYKTDSDAPNFFLCKGENGEICIGLFNWDDTPATLRIDGFRKAGRFEAFAGQPAFSAQGSSLSVPLAGVHSLLLKYTGSETFEQLRNELHLTLSK